jgi:shikimate kinase
MLSLKQHITLIGFMGSGKTRLGKKLAKVLGLPFFDTDQLIEKQEQNTISEIFARHGEAHFRRLESNLVQELMSLPPAVIATGGGLPCYLSNLEKLKKMGIIIYLHRPAKELTKRLSQAKEKRPLIAELNDIELNDFVADKLAKREFFYNQAHLRIERENQKPKAMIQALVDAGVLS